MMSWGHTKSGGGGGEGRNGNNHNSDYEFEIDKMDSKVSKINSLASWDEEQNDGDEGLRDERRHGSPRNIKTTRGPQTARKNVGRRRNSLSYRVRGTVRNTVMLMKTTLSVSLHTPTFYGPQYSFVWTQVNLVLPPLLLVSLWILLKAVLHGDVSSVGRGGGWTGCEYTTADLKWALVELSDGTLHVADPELADAKDVEFFAPVLQHYLFTDLSLAPVGVAGIVWATAKEMWNIWSKRSQFAYTIIVATPVLVTQTLSYLHGNYSLVAPLGLLVLIFHFFSLTLLKPCRIPMHLSLYAAASTSLFVVHAKLGIFYVDSLLKPAVRYMQSGWVDADAAEDASLFTDAFGSRFARVTAVLVELVLTGFFFSVWVPFGSKLQGPVMVRTTLAIHRYLWEHDREIVLETCKATDLKSKLGTMKNDEDHVEVSNLEVVVDNTDILQQSETNATLSNGGAAEDVQVKLESPCEGDPNTASGAVVEKSESSPSSAAAVHRRGNSVDANLQVGHSSSSASSVGEAVDHAGTSEELTFSATARKQATLHSQPPLNLTAPPAGTDSSDRSSRSASAKSLSQQHQPAKTKRMEDRESLDSPFYQQRKIDLENFCRPLVNTMIDMYRYAYGRGILLGLSPAAFVFIVAKEMIGDMTHFGIGYFSSYQIFLLKLQATVNQAAAAQDEESGKLQASTKQPPVVKAQPTTIMKKHTTLSPTKHVRTVDFKADTLVDEVEIIDEENDQDCVDDDEAVQSQHTTGESRKVFRSKSRLARRIISKTSTVRSLISVVSWKSWTSIRQGFGRTRTDRMTGDFWRTLLFDLKQVKVRYRVLAAFELLLREVEKLVDFFTVTWVYEYDDRALKSLRAKKAAQLFAEQAPDCSPSQLVHRVSPAPVGFQVGLLQTSSTSPVVLPGSGAWDHRMNAGAQQLESAISLSTLAPAAPSTSYSSPSVRALSAIEQRLEAPDYAAKPWWKKKVSNGSRASTVSGRSDDLLLAARIPAKTSKSDSQQVHDHPEGVGAQPSGGSSATSGETSGVVDKTETQHDECLSRAGSSTARADRKRSTKMQKLSTHSKQFFARVSRWISPRRARKSTLWSVSTEKLIKAKQRHNIRSPALLWKRWRGIKKGVDSGKTVETRKSNDKEDDHALRVAGKQCSSSSAGLSMQSTKSVTRMVSKTVSTRLAVAARSTLKQIFTAGTGPTYASVSSLKSRIETLQAQASIDREAEDDAEVDEHSDIDHDENGAQVHGELDGRSPDMLSQLSPAEQEEMTRMNTLRNASESGGAVRELNRVRSIKRRRRPRSSKAPTTRVVVSADGLEDELVGNCLFPVVVKGELDSLQRFIEYVQSEIFVRFQMRAAVRFFTCGVLVVSGLLGMCFPTSIAKLPGYPRGDASLYFRSQVLTLFVVDVVTYLVLTFAIHLNERISLKPWRFLLGEYMAVWNSENIPRGEIKARRFFLAFGFYFGTLMVSKKWEPYSTNAIVSQTNLPSLSLDHVAKACKEFAGVSLFDWGD
eukprot:g16722.t1